MSYNVTRSKKKRIKAVAQKVKIFRANEPLISVFMWGINHTVSELTHLSVPVMLMPDDFKASSKIKVDNHLFNKENLPSHYKIKEYCPIVFRKLREIFGIKEQSYLESLTKLQPKFMDSSKSGAKFYLSYDKRLVCKTLFSEEVMQMHQILKSYHQHVVERNGKTLLTQYLGMYRITVEGTETYLVIMRNIFGHKLIIHKKYDLKGSTVQRSASMKEKTKDIPTFKDNDFLNEGIKIHMGKEGKAKLLETLAHDCNFMVKNNLMDYSLICGIHDLEKDKFIVAPHQQQQLQQLQKDQQEIRGGRGDGHNLKFSSSGWYPHHQAAASHVPLRARFDSEGETYNDSIDSKNNNALFRYNSARYYPSPESHHSQASPPRQAVTPPPNNGKEGARINYVKSDRTTAATTAHNTTSTTEEFDTTDDQIRSGSNERRNDLSPPPAQYHTTSGCFSTDEATSGPEAHPPPLSPTERENCFYVSPSATLTITASDEYGRIAARNALGGGFETANDNASLGAASNATASTEEQNIIPLGVKIRALIDPAIDVYAIPSSPEQTDKPKIYFMAIIDLLTRYGMKKKTAHAAKTVKHGAEAEFTTVNPDQYGKRFLEFVERCID